MPAESVKVVYFPRILSSLDDIRHEFRVSKDTVRNWIEKGAPISVEGEGTTVRYSAEVGKLQTWLETHC